MSTVNCSLYRGQILKTTPNFDQNSFTTSVWRIRDETINQSQLSINYQFILVLTNLDYFQPDECTPFLCAPEIALRLYWL